MAVTYENSCRGKYRYNSRKMAREGRKRTRAEGSLTIYRCLFCEFFHLGHKPEALRRGELDKQQWRGR